MANRAYWRRVFPCEDKKTCGYETKDGACGAKANYKVSTTVTGYARSTIFCCKKHLGYIGRQGKVLTEYELPIAKEDKDATNKKHRR